MVKIKSNIDRDKWNTSLLEQLGWHVIRLWESDIRQDPSASASFVREIISKHIDA